MIFGYSAMSTTMVGCEGETAIEEIDEGADDTVEDAANALEDAGEGDDGPLE